MSDIGKNEVKEYNAKKVTAFKGVDCPLCLNKGNYYVVTDSGTICTKLCERCKRARTNAARICASGLEKQLKRCTFDSFKTTELFQEDMLNTAKKYVETGIEEKRWFLACGQSGCGKTHLCTAIVGEILAKTDYEVKYEIWPEMAQKMKSLLFSNESKYMEELGYLQTIDVLYIDDFFKPRATDSDKTLAYNIINYRYNNDKITLISTEFYSAELGDIDEAIAGRIVQKAGEYIDIERSREKNYRLN